MLEILTTICWLWLLLALHEAAHFYTAYFLTRPIARLRVGRGPLLREWMWRGIVCEFRLLPASGCVTLVWGSRNRWVDVSIYAAGPFANLITAGFLSYLGFELAACLSFGLGFTNLLPFYKMDGQMILDRLKRAKP